LAASLKSPDGVTLELPERKAINNPVNFANASANPPPSPNAGGATQPRFPILKPNNALVPVLTPPDAAASAPANALGASSGAAAAISRFAPRVNPDGSSGFPAMPAMPVAATSSGVDGR
jgi:hypothetical protein